MHQKLRIQNVSGHFGRNAFEGSVSTFFPNPNQIRPYFSVVCRILNFICRFGLGIHQHRDVDSVSVPDLTFSIGHPMVAVELQTLDEHFDHNGIMLMQSGL